MEDARDTVMKRFKDRCPIIDLVMDRKLISMTKEEKEAYKAFRDRVAMPTNPRKLTPEEIEKLKKEGRI